MRFGHCAVIDLIIFDEDGNIVVKLDSLMDTHIIFDGCSCSIIANDALLNIKIMEFMNETEESDLSDYEKFLQDKKEVKTIVFNGKSRRFKECKVIAKTVGRSEISGIDHVWTFEFPKVYIENTFLLKGNGEDVATFPYSLIVKEYNEKGDMFKLHIHQ